MLYLRVVRCDMRWMRVVQPPYQIGGDNIVVGVTATRTWTAIFCGRGLFGTSNLWAIFNHTHSCPSWSWILCTYTRTLFASNTFTVAWEGWCFSVHFLPWSPLFTFPPPSITTQAVTVQETKVIWSLLLYQHKGHRPPKNALQHRAAGPSSCVPPGLALVHLLRCNKLSLFRVRVKLRVILSALSGRTTTIFFVCAHQRFRLSLKRFKFDKDWRLE